ncbi:MAG: TRAP transporter substrate-binding protein [Succinivibrio sp.]|jgi:tripartite ATP-independent transporter DctP family solute receptor|nr:TRAP transporter substrate-binding protein [Succinivibrio sp.]
MKLAKRLIAGAVFAAAAAFSANAMAADSVTFKLGFVDPANSSYALGGKKFAEELDKLTGGKVKVQVVAGGTLGGEREMYEGAQMGTMDMISVVNTVLSQFIPELVLLDQPFLFDNDEQAHAAVDGKLGQLIAKKAEAQGVHIIGALESGFRDTFSKNPIKTADDYKGMKIRTMENKMQIAAFNALGAIATPMPATEQYTALQQGTIDGCENAVGNMLINRYYEVIKNVTNSHHQFTYIFIGVSDRAWKKIPDEFKPKVYEAMKAAVAWQRQNLKEINENAVKELKAKGVQFYDIDREAMKAKVLPAVEKLRANVPQEWIDAYKEAVAAK